MSNNIALWGTILLYIPHLILHVYLATKNVTFLDSLVAHKFLDEVNVEMSDLSSMDSVMYRFRNNHEQSVINGLMLNDQKKRTHFEVAVYYASSFRGGGDSLGENDSLSTDITTVPATNWALYHVIALHYDLAEVPV